MPRLAAGVRLLFILAVVAEHSCATAEAPRVNPPRTKPADVRLGRQRSLRDEFHPWTPPATKEAWEAEAARIRRQLLVSNGLWPLPERTPLEPVVHGLVDRGDYTVEKVFFRSRPGVYVTGSLFRPKSSGESKRPGVLCPYGHWQDGRFYDAGEKDASRQLATGAETYLSGARFPLQARCVQLARMGCTVFHYDMVGIADNTALPHREGFNDVAAELWLQNKMGLQTWNSMRALDFLESLPDVDPARIGVTGASGGGTQTFMLCGLDSRPAVAFPAVMVGTAMQGGCQCENASYLRVGINNIAIAALTAPRPMAMTGANDWTINIESRGLPELKAVYAFDGKSELVEATCFPQFPHNYNEVSREVMYPWLARHLKLQNVPVQQSDFWPLTRADLAVFDDRHLAPSDWLNAAQLREKMTQDARDVIAGWNPGDATDRERYRDVVGGAAEVMFGGAVDWTSPIDELQFGPAGIATATISHSGKAIPMVLLQPIGKAKNEIVLWADERGKRSLFRDDGTPTAAVQQLRDAGYHVASADLFLTGEFLSDGDAALYPVDKGFPGYTFCYNLPLIAHRVRDLALVHAWLKKSLPSASVPEVHLVGTGTAGLWALLARTRCPSKTERTVVDLNGFTFESVTQVDDPNLLPGALRYGDVDGLAALAAPSPLVIHRPAGDLPLLSRMTVALEGRLEMKSTPLTEADILPGLRTRH